MTVEAIGNVDMSDLNEVAHPFGLRVYTEEMGLSGRHHPAIGPNDIFAKIAHAIIPLRQDIAVISSDPQADEVHPPELTFYVHNKKNLQKIKNLAEATNIAFGVRVAVTSPPKDSTLFRYSSWRR